jgi:hypothetical protein
MIPGSAIPLIFASLGGVVASGGTVTDIVDSGLDYRVHAFTSTAGGTFTVTQPVLIEYLVVGGGGAPGTSWSTGGGGAGGLLYTPLGSGTTFGVGSYTITVGAGGTANYNALNDGGDSSIVGGAINIVATGGGGGGAFAAPGKNGGSGGGGGSRNSTPAELAGLGTVGQGYDGGLGGIGTNPYTGGGGGGAGGAGNPAVNNTRSGRGGHGVTISITGSSVIYAAGGHGGTSNGVTEASEIGSVLPGVSGGANTGSGGGGSDGTPGAKGNGGSGIVVLRYRI